MALFKKEKKEKEEKKNKKVNKNAEDIEGVENSGFEDILSGGLDLSDISEFTDLDKDIAKALADEDNPKRRILEMYAEEKAKDEEFKRIHHKTVKKKNKIQQLSDYLRLISFKKLNSRIEAYGFKYSFSKYISNIVILIMAVIASSFLFKLETQYVPFLILFGICIMPIIILAQIQFMANNYKFEQINTYLQEMIISFKTRPKILYSLYEVREMFDDGIADEIQAAIDYIQHADIDEDSTNTYEKGLKIIEDKYRCSRIRSLHNLMLTCEKENSMNYDAAINDLYDDIQAWKSRIYEYQINLNNTRTQFNIVLLLTIGVSSIMINILPETLTGFVSNGVYQLSTCLMLCIFLAMFCFVQTKLTGNWLISDIDGNDYNILKDLYYVETYDENKARKKSFERAALASAIPLFGHFIFQNRTITIIGIGIVLFCLVKDRLTYKTKRKTVENEIRKQFPSWLRDISLNVYNWVVTRAIRQSMDTCPLVLKYHIEKLIEETEEDPVTIRPYNHFLEEYYITDIASSMKSLYVIKSQNSTEGARLISDLIQRNQEMMANSEKIRNENQLAIFNMLGTVPMVVGALKMMVDMALMILEFMGTMSTIGM